MGTDIDQPWWVPVEQPPRDTANADRWNPPPAQHLPALRASLMRHLRSPGAHGNLASLLHSGRGIIAPHTGDRERDARILLGEERDRLAAAELYYVTPDMTGLAMAAAETLPVHTFNTQDVPAEAGLIVFTEPIGGYEVESPITGMGLTKIVACSWGPSPFFLDGSGVWLTFWSLTDPREEVAFLRSRGLSRREAEQRIRSSIAELTWDNELTINYGEGNLTVLQDSPDGPQLLRFAPLATQDAWEQIKDYTTAWAHIVRAAWLLMTQPGVTDIEERSARPSRQLDTRSYEPPPIVRVVRIRHNENAPTTVDSAGRQYHVRWTVRGHWRNQWYPTRGEHRPVWINPYIKGPEGAPLHTGETVHVLDTESISHDGPPSL